MDDIYVAPAPSEGKWAHIIWARDGKSVWAMCGDQFSRATSKCMRSQPPGLLCHACTVVRLELEPGWRQIMRVLGP